MGLQSHSKLPVIDFSKEKLTQGSYSWASVGKSVLQALEDYGCFIALYDKVAPELHDSIFSSSKELYDLPMETKVKNTSDVLGFGYGGGFATMPLFEYFGIENGETIKATESFTNLMWPNGNNHFSESALSYSKLLVELSHMVIQMVFENYGVEKYCNSQTDDLAYLMRFIKYRAPMNKERNTGLHPHTDKSFITVVDQNHVNGLQIETRNGDWISFEPTPSACVIFAGDGLMAWSNGRIYSASHRVTMTGYEDKYTIAIFAFTKGMVETPEELVDEEHPLQFKPFNHYGYLKYCGGEGMKYKNPLKAYCGILTYPPS